ncbi:phosphatase PAP2 family protein, partial [bacterium]
MKEPLRPRLAHALRAALAGRRVRVVLALLVAVFDAIMIGLSFLGSWGTIPIVAPLLAAGLAWRGLRRGAVFVLLSLLGIPLDTTLKLIWARARPDAGAVQVVVAQSGYSFPSGHAVLGTAFYGTLAVLAWVHLVDRPWRWPVTITLAALPPFIDLSRIYLGAHWLSDVIAGSAVGLALILPTSRWYASRARADSLEATSLEATSRETTAPETNGARVGDAEGAAPSRPDAAPSPPSR